MLTPLTTYRGTDSAPVTNAHNVLANEQTGFVYIVGARSCMGGLHMVDFHDPMNPTFAGCGKDDHYVHDAQCVVYRGPDTEHEGKEICVTYNGEDSSFSIVDVSDKNAPHELSTTHYANGQYTHNGALTDDHSHLVLSDELDEQRNGNPTRTFMFDVTDLDAPKALGTYDAATKAIDHNLFIRDGFVYQANYEAGLRILDASKVPMGMLHEVAFFDTFPNLDAAELKGSWTAYPYFESGIVVINGTEGGMFVLAPQREVLARE
jgi:choice-of-anchor B domain-containing protein